MTYQAVEADASASKRLQYLLYSDELGPAHPANEQTISKSQQLKLTKLSSCLCDMCIMGE